MWYVFLKYWKERLLPMSWIPRNAEDCIQDLKSFPFKYKIGAFFWVFQALLERSNLDIEFVINLKQSRTEKIRLWSSHRFQQPKLEGEYVVLFQLSAVCEQLEKTNTLTSIILDKLWFRLWWKDRVYLSYKTSVISTTARLQREEKTISSQLVTSRWRNNENNNDELNN